MFRDIPSFDEGRSISFGFEGARPRAATVSMCRYTVPDSPMCKPSISPPNSPPSLILPPLGHRNMGLQRSISRLSCLDERLASSAPSASAGILSFGSDNSGSFHSSGSRGNALQQAGTSPEFTLLEEEEPAEYERFHHSYVDVGAPNHHLVGMDDDDADPDILLAEFPENPVSESFSASPVLISCLRDIANSRRH